MEWLPCRNSTNRGTTRHSMTFSIGGFFSFDKSLRNLVVASSCRSGSSEKTPATISSATLGHGSASTCGADRISTYRSIPTTRPRFIIRIQTSRWQEVALLCYILLSFLSSNLYLLLLSATAEVILFEAAFVLIICDNVRVRF